MDAETIVAIVAAVIAGIAAGIAVWQAKEAGKSRVAAERQAAAAEESVAEMRKQTEALEHERAARDEHEGPRFTVGPHTRSDGARHYFPVTMTDGPEVDVTITDVRGSNASGLEVFVPAGHDEPRRMVQGTEAEFVIEFPPTDDTVHIEVRVECLEVGGHGRRWERWQVVEFRGPPRVYFA